MKWYLWAGIRGDVQYFAARSSPDPDRRDSNTASKPRAFFESVWQDVRYSVRSLRTRPLFATVAVVTLGLGIGAMTAMFSVVDGVLLHRLPYGDPGKLVSVWVTHPEWRGHPFLGEYWNKGPLSYSEYETWRDATTQFSSVAVHGEHTMSLTGMGDPEQISVGLASAGLLRTLSVSPTIGRGFLPGEDGATAQRVVLLSDALWRTRFAADPDILGQTLTLDGNVYNVIGVLPPGFRLRTLVLGGADNRGDRAAWIPVGQPEIMGGLANQRMEAIGRLATGVSIEQAQAETAALFAGEEDPASAGARLVSRKSDVTGAYRSALLLLFGAAGILLLAACCNVAMLATGEAAGRRHETSTRAALGASTTRILRQNLTESVMLGLAGSVVAVALAHAGTSLLVHLGPPIPRLEEVQVNTRVLLFACLAGMVAGVVFGIAPSMLFARDSVAATLRKSENRTTTMGRRMQQSVVAVEIALTAVLLVSGGLLARSLANLFVVDPGFSTENLATFHIPLPEHRYQSGADALEFFRAVQERIETTPGVSSASGTATLPFSGAFEVETPVLRFSIVGREVEDGERSPQAWRGIVLPRLHEVLGVPLLAGRGFTEADGPGATRVAIINETLARRYWRNESPVGATVELGGDTWTIVGIVGDVRHAGLDEEVAPMLYLPLYQHPTHAVSFVARINGDPQQMLSQLQREVWSIDANVPVTRARMMSALVSESSREDRYRALLMLVFSATATVLAAAGIFGVTAQGVTRQTREMGIRLALGAEQSGLVGMVLRGSLVTALLGAAVGLAAAFWTSRLLSQFLFGVEASDLVTYGSVALFLVAVCLAASFLPARRVTRVDPVEVLRVE
jgi:putative ABC transport system permease protein